MSHNSYTRPFWASGSDLFASEMADIDAKTFKAVNGDEGGVWANTSPIVFGGAFTVGGLTTLSGTADVSAMNFFGLASFAANIVVNSNAQFNGPITGTASFPGTVNLQGSTFVTGTTLDTNVPFEIRNVTNFRSGGVTNVKSGHVWNFQSGSVDNFDGTLNLSSAGVWNLDGTVNLTRTINISGTTTISGTVSVAAPVTQGAAGQIRKHTITSATSGTHTVDPSACQRVFIPSLTAALQLNLMAGTEGDEIEFMLDPTNTTYNTGIGPDSGVSVNQGALLIATIGTGHSIGCRYAWHGSSWYLISLAPTQ